MQDLTPISLGGVPLAPVTALPLLCNKSASIGRRLCGTFGYVDPNTPLIDFEAVEETDDAHEHGLVFHQVEDVVPLRVEDFDDEDEPSLTA